jgi:hypothetical protein
MKIFRRLTLLSAFFLVSCATQNAAIQNSNFSVKQHRVAIVAALGLVRGVSQNGREVLSLYHDRKLKNIDVTAKTKERLYTKAVILGPRRPYNVSVQVHIERRDPDSGEFQEVGIEENLSDRRASAIREMLNQSREEGGTFDEEAPF